MINYYDIRDGDKELHCGDVLYFWNLNWLERIKLSVKLGFCQGRFSPPLFRSVLKRWKKVGRAYRLDLTLTAPEFIPLPKNTKITAFTYETIHIHNYYAIVSTRSKWARLHMSAVENSCIIFPGFSSRVVLEINTGESRGLPMDESLVNVVKLRESDHCKCEFKEISDLELKEWIKNA